MKLPLAVRAFLSTAFAALVFLLPAAGAQADAFGPQFQATVVGPPGDLNWHGEFSDIAYDAVLSRHLVVYIGSTTPHVGTTDGTDDVYGQFVNDAGERIGDPIRISNTSLGEEEYNPPSVIFNPATREYLVAWSRDTDETVHVQRVTAAGDRVGTPDEQISGSAGDVEALGLTRDSATGRYLVVWKGNSDPTGIAFGQLLAADGTEVGPNDFPFGGSVTSHVDDALGVAYNATDHQYLAVFRAQDAAGEYEIYGQLISADGAPIGPDDFRISHTGPDGNTDWRVTPPNVAWDAADDRYLVAWPGTATVSGVASDKQEMDIFGQMILPTGDQVGPDDFRISDMGPNGDPKFDAFRPRILWDPNQDQFLLTWHGDDNTPPQVDNESEIWGQWVKPEGVETGSNDFRISQDGPDGSTQFAANRPAVDYNSNSCDAMVVWGTGKIGNFGSVSEEKEVFGSRVSGAPCPPKPVTGTQKPGPKPGDCANAKTGNSKRNKLIGTPFGDILKGLAGNDRISGGKGNDCLYGGKGNDKLSGGSGKDKLFGSSGNDSLGGGTGNDKLSGGSGKDKLKGGKGKDTFSAGSGDDKVNSRDGVKETVNCGKGDDSAVVDKNDKVKGCESVKAR
ncbi:MAG: calcium-binding protein [Thermoleophilaceae bacterium]